MLEIAGGIVLGGILLMVIRFVFYILFIHDIK